ncbi:snake venom vascular endothelial growth factor toxin-like [Aulostomus maculatus]
MRSFTTNFLLSAVLLVQLVPAQISPSPETGHSRVMSLLEVLGKSACQPMEQLVDVEQGYPRDLEPIYIPDCVPLLRCSGCCMDETLECQPTLERNITMEVMKILPMKSIQHVQLTFVEHQQCECRLGENQLTQESSNEATTHRPRRRKHKKTASGCSKCPVPEKKIPIS